MNQLTALMLALGCVSLGCSESSEPATDSSGGSSGSGGSGGAKDPDWSPGIVLSSSGRPNARGLIDLRGLITPTPFTPTTPATTPRSIR